MNSNQEGANEFDVKGAGEDKTLISSPPAAQQAEAHQTGAQEAGIKQERLQVGELLADGRYKVLSYIGQGAMATVYKVEQVALRKQFALKLLSPYNHEDPRIRRFQKEAQAASQLDHPNLVRAIDFGVAEGNRPFIVMDFVAGTTLSQYLEEHARLTLKETIDLFTPICAGLSYAHQKGVIHRDLKPSNIMLVPVENEPGRFIPKVVDFGIAKIESAEESALTKTGEVFGTPLYMSPEQCSGRPVDKRSDIYALGCVIYQALVGSPPFMGDNAIAIIAQHLNVAPQSMSEATMGGRFSPALEAVVAKALSKNPDDRQSDCMKLAQELIESPHTSVSKSVGNVAPESKLSGKVIWAIAFAMLAIIGVATYGILEFNRNKPEPAQTQAKQTKEALVETSFEPKHIATPEGLENKFSRITGSEREFVFPENLNLGDLYWRSQDHLYSVPAAHTVRTPANAKILLDASGSLYELKPSLITRFRTGDLDGVRISASFSKHGVQMLTFDDDNHEAAIKNLTLLENLRILFFRGFQILPKLVSTPGEMSNLRWLVFDGCCSDTNQLVNCSNLDKLRVLLVTKFTHPKKLIDKLSPNMRALGLPECVFDDADVMAINRLKSLNTLYLGDDVVNPESLVKMEKVLSGLKRLGVGMKAVGRANSPWFKYAKHLKVLVITGSKYAAPEWKNEVTKQFPHCKIIFDLDFSVEGRDWFDPRSFDPYGAEYGLSL